MGQFNIIRGIFWLVAAMVGLHIVIVLSCLGFCMYYGQEIVEGKYRCDPQGKCMDTLRYPFTFIKEFWGGK